jgi:hypothetical protein
MLVVSTRCAGAEPPAAGDEPAAYGATIRDRGAGEHEGVGRPIIIMRRELELVAGRLYDAPGCAASANP